MSTNKDYQPPKIEHTLYFMGVPLRLDFTDRGLSKEEEDSIRKAYATYNAMSRHVRTEGIQGRT